MKYYFINHGFMGSNIENWFPWFKENIDNEENLCIIPQYPIDKEHHFYSDWKKVLDAYNNFEMINEESIIIGHSTGSSFSMKYLLENKIKVDKLVLVSGFNNYYAENEDDFHKKVNQTFYLENEELVKVKDYANEIICIYGDNDPYITQEALHNLVEVLDANEVIIHNGGHLNKAAGYTKFEEILKII